MHRKPGTESTVAQGEPFSTPGLIFSEQEIILNTPGIAREKDLSSHPGITSVLGETGRECQGIPLQKARLYKECQNNESSSSLIKV